MSLHNDHRDNAEYDGFRVEEVWLLTQVDPISNQEGLLAVVNRDNGRTVEPAMATDRARLDSLKKIFSNEPGAFGTVVSVKHFKLVDTEVITLDGSSN